MAVHIHDEDNALAGVYQRFGYVDSVNTHNVVGGYDTAEEARADAQEWAEGSFKIVQYSIEVVA